MADVHSPEIRSYNMSQIHGKDTKPEEKVRKYLFSMGFRYRKNDKRLPGTPDVVLPKYRTVVFVNGCFWHCHQGCKYFVLPQTNTQFWNEKLENNAHRDLINYEKLTALGWRVIIVWECELRKDQFQNRMDRLVNEIQDAS